MAITKNMVSDNKHVVNQIVTLSKELLFVLFLLALVLVLKPTTANAATLNVATGNGATNLGDSLCQIEEAINSINAQQNEGDCIATGTYGIDDTINLPNGTIDGSMINSGSGLYISESLTILGQGKDSSTIRDLRFALSGSGASFSLKDFVLKGDVGLYSYMSESVIIENLEVDFEGAENYFNVDNPHNLTVKNSYIHNLSLTGSGASTLLYIESNNDYWPDHQSNISIIDSTFSDSNRGIALSMSGSDATAKNVDIKNNTFSNLESFDEQIAYGIGVHSYSSNTILNYTTTNNTFKNITGPLDGSGDPTAMAIAEASFENGKINHTAQNDVYSSGNGTAVNYYQYLGESSVESDLTTTSLGGNLSSDNSFGSRLNHATDQNNVTTLASFLGMLSDNGGPVPTIALLANSPAIDSGTNVSGMTTDARGVTRPQGTAFDSGAYELEQSTPENPGGSESGSGSSNTTTVTDPGLKSPTSSVSQFSNKPITITTPTGTTITSSNTVTESSLGAQDTNNQYPLGLVNFTFNTTQTDNLVTLTFITDLKPNQVKPRKYNPDTKAYTDITNYTLTETTINGQHALVLTYTITDNGDLDTNKTTGIISDPVGLAMSNSTYDQLANTGSNAVYTAIAGGVMVVASAAALLLTKLKKSTKYLFRH